MVTASVERVSDNFAEVLADMDLVSAGALGGLFAGGSLLAQEVADNVLPALDFSPDPSSQTGLAAAALVKFAAAVVLATAAFAVGGDTAVLVAGGLGFGMVHLAMLDLFDLAQGGGIPGTATSGSSSSGSASRSPRAVSAGGSSAGSNAGPSGPAIRRASSGGHIDNGAYRGV